MIEPAKASDEAALIRAVGRGNEAAVEQLYRCYSDRVLRFVYRRIGERLEDAEEITQDTFISAIRLAPGFEARASVFAWLCGIAKLRITDYMRHEARERRIPKTLIDPIDDLRDCQSERPAEPLAEQFAATQLVDSLLADLSPDERDVLTLRYVEQLSIREIAPIVKRSEKAVEALLMRAKKKPRAKLKEWFLGAEGGRP